MILSQIRIIRILDITLSLIGLLVLSPIIIITYFIILVKDKDRVFFKQKRVGINGKEFVIYKFRTMYSLNNNQSLVFSTKEKELHLLVIF